MSPPIFGSIMGSKKSTTAGSGLTDQESRLLAQCERAIEAAMPGILPLIEAGKALATIRDRELHRGAWKSWEAYIEERWRMTARRASQLIAFATATEVVEAVATETGTAVPVLTERAVRPMAGMDKATVEAVVVEAAAAPGGITPATIREAAGRRRPARGVPRPARLKVPGGTVVVEFTRRGAAAGATVESILVEALRKVRGEVPAADAA
jgi:hypothetical protein